MDKDFHRVGHVERFVLLVALVCPQVDVNRADVVLGPDDVVPLVQGARKKAVAPAGTHAVGGRYDEPVGGKPICLFKFKLFYFA